MQLNANWYELMTGDVMVQRAEETARTRTDFEIDFAIWKDMVEEPEKYGDDIYDWLALHETLMRGAGRWRLGAYEYAIQAREEAAIAEEQVEWRAAFTPIAKQAAALGMKKWCERDVKAFIAKLRTAVVTIQAAVRGHQARSKLPFRDCCLCLSHRVCPLETDVGMMCRGCAEQGPYTEETGPLADPWSEFRGDSVDLTLRAPPPPLRLCAYCESTLPADAHAYCDTICRDYHADEATPVVVQRGHRHGQCRWCFMELDEGQTNGYCDSDCWASYQKESWRDYDYHD